MSYTDFGLTIVKDYPIKGINFIDINGLLAKPACFTKAIDTFCHIISTTLTIVPAKTAVISPESRGFLFGAPVAHKLGLPLLAIRKKGKIPNNPYPFHITNEYTSYDMEVDGDLLQDFAQFIYIDDILATGQTLAAVKQALETKGKKILLAVHLTAVADLKGVRDSNPALKDLPIKEVI